MLGLMINDHMKQLNIHVMTIFDSDKEYEENIRNSNLKQGKKF